MSQNPIPTGWHASRLTTDGVLGRHNALFALSSNECAFAGCDAPMIDNGTGSVVGIICHIRARNSGGPRYTSGLTDWQLHGPRNLILLCSPHHKVIDDHPDEYTVERLEEMKDAHESGAQPLDRDQMMAALAALAGLAPPAVPDEWWRRPGAPSFGLTLSQGGGEDPSLWRFTAAIGQELGREIGDVRARFAGDLAETALAKPEFIGNRENPKWQLPAWHPQARSSHTMDHDSSIGLGPTEFAIEIRFWWDGSDRCVLMVWPSVEGFQTSPYEIRYPASES